jgi:hypothetical protein
MEIMYMFKIFSKDVLNKYPFDAGIKGLTVQPL